jgi:hypothetical protein
LSHVGSAVTPFLINYFRFLSSLEEFRDLNDFQSDGFTFY